MKKPVFVALNKLVSFNFNLFKTVWLKTIFKSEVKKLPQGKEDCYKIPEKQAKVLLVLRSS
jgi:hypothetical protein